MKTLVNLQLKTRLGIALILLPLILVSFPLIVHGQENSGINLTVSPSLFELSAAPGETVTQKVRIRNNSNTPQPLKASIGKLAPSEDLSQIIPEDPKPEDEYINWLKFENPNFTAAAQEWTDVGLTITVPQSAAYGYYYALRFTPSNPNTNDQITAKVQGEIVVPVLLKVKKEGAKTEAQVVDFKADRGVYEYLPAEFTAQIKNTGNVHMKPRGSIFISGQGNKDLAILDFNTGSGNILPSSIREFKTVWNDGFITYEPKMAGDQEVTDSSGKVQKELVVHWDKLTHLRFGPYQARLFMVYDDGAKDVVLEKTANFWVVPYTVIGIVLGIVILVIVIIRWMLGSYVKSQLKKHQR